MGDLVINFQNFSFTEMQSDYNSRHLEKGGNTVKTWPAGPLLAGSGAQQCLITQNLSKLDVGPCNFCYCWNTGSWRFGVKIISYEQVAGMGDRPTWQIAYDQRTDHSDPNWIDNGSEPGDSFSWPAEVGYSILATPTSTHQGLSINVVINDS